MDDAFRSAGSPEFPSTCWSLVAEARDPGSPGMRDALTGLCRAYWYPLFAYVRRQGYGPDDARDLTQEFFARLIQGEALRGVDREKGRFRAYLLACCRHFLANQRIRDRAAKRGGAARRSRSTWNPPSGVTASSRPTTSARSGSSNAAGRSP